MNTNTLLTLAALAAGVWFISNRGGWGGTLAAAVPSGTPYPIRGKDIDDFTNGFDLREDPRWQATSVGMGWDWNSGEYMRPNY